MIFICLLLSGFGRNILQLTNGFFIYTQLDVAQCLILKMNKALCAGQEENLSHGVIKDFSQTTDKAVYYKACYVLWIPVRKDAP